MGKTKIQCPPGEKSLILDGIAYNINEIASIVKSFRAYRESLQQFSLYASNNKIDQINILFNLFWFLITQSLQEDSTQRYDIITKIKEEFFYLINQLNIVDFMSIKSFEHQCSIILHIIMIVNLLQQESGNECTDLSMVIQYLMQWVIMTMLSLSFSHQQNLESSRNLIKKELCDSFLMVHLLQKAFGSDTQAWAELINKSLQLLYRDSITLITQLTVGLDHNSHKKFSFSEWKLKPVPFLTFDSKSSLTSLDLTLFSTNLILLSMDYSLGPSIDQLPTNLPDWSLLSQLLQDHLSKHLSTHTQQPLSQVSLKLLSNLMLYQNNNNTGNSNLSHEHFLVIYKHYIQQNRGQTQQQTTTVRQQREILNGIAARYPQENGGQKQRGCEGLLEAYLKTQDQRQVKQLYQKVCAIMEVQIQAQVMFAVQMTFVGAIESDRQAMMVMKKALGIAQAEANKDDNFEISKMIISIAGASNKFKGQEGDDPPIDKSDIILCLMGLIKKIVSYFITTVLKNKGNLNQNDYLNKTETYLMYLSSIFKPLADFAQPLKGVWRQHEYRWLSDPQHLVEDIFSLYSYLAIKTPDLESLQLDFLRLLKSFLSRRRSHTSKKPSISSPPTQSPMKINAQQEQLSSSLEGTDELIAECLIYEEQDSLMVKEIMKAEIRHRIERVIKGYMNVGKDIRVISEMFKVAGLIDGVLIEGEQMKTIQVLQKIQSSKYGPLSDSLDPIQKPMLLSLLITGYLHKLLSRASLSRICGPESLSLCKTDLSQQRDLIIQISYNILENLIRGLLIYQRPNQVGSGSVPEAYRQSLKLYRDMRSHMHKQEYQLNQNMLVFKDQTNENRVLEAFTKTEVGEYEAKTNIATYEKVSEIFTNFFKEATKQNSSPGINQHVFINTVIMYVAILPGICKQFQELQNQNKGDFRSYLNFLKSILLSFMVKLQHLSQTHHNLGQLISQIINIVMPSFFGNTTGNKLDLQSLETHDSYYFYQYLALQYQTNSDDHRLATNQKHFLELSLRTIETNLNTLIPALFLTGIDDEGLKKYILEDCPVLKGMLDAIAQNHQQRDEEFLSSLIEYGFIYLRTHPNVSSMQWSTPQEHQSVLKSQRKLLCLFILLLMLDPRLPSSTFFLRRLCHRLTSHLISETIHTSKPIDTQHLTFENNLNVLAMLRVAKAIGCVTGEVTRYIAVMIDQGMRVVTVEASLEKEVERAQVVRERIRDRGRKDGQEVGTSWFLSRSAHQFILSDQNLITKMILNISLDILQHHKIETECVTLLRLLPREQNSNSKIQSQIIEKLEQIILFQDEAQSLVKLPDKFKSLNQLLF